MTVKESIKALVQQMSLKEKCAVLSGRDVWHTRPIERLRISSITLSDGPSGLRKQAAEGDHLGLNESTKATNIPSAATIANSWSPEAAEAMGAVVGADAAAQDVQVLLGPGLNTKRSPLCGRSFEYYSEDPYLTGKLAAAFIRGVQSKGVSACAKHFAVNSQELQRMASDSVLDERTLRELYLTNFEIAIQEGKPRALMTSYNKVNGSYANENSQLYDILRREWGFDGMVVTDWGGSNDFTEGVRAGMNLEMPAAGDDSPCQLLQAVKDGKISEEIIDRRVEELLTLVLTEKPKASPVDEKAQHEAVRKAAEQCIVLLKNDRNILPLQHSAKVAVIGDFAAHPRYQGAGSSMVNAWQADDTLELMTDYFPNAVGFSQGFERLDKRNDELAAQAVELAKGADCVLLYLGLPEGFETEGLDRAHMRLPDNQVALLNRLAEVNEHIVVVLSCGSAVEMPWIDSCQALVYGCLGGEAAAGAMLRVLSGEVNPGGKLAETFPVAYADLPVSHYYPGKEYTSEYREGLYVGYRYFVTAKKPVRFPFGFGMNYTQFRYENLTVEPDGVSFDLTNCGACGGDEIVQLYVSLPGAKVFRPARELKGFRRVSLKAGETQRVKILFDDYTFRYFNVRTHQWEVEGGSYDILIGASSEDIRLKGARTVSGTDAPDPYEGKNVDCYRSCALQAVPDVAFEALLGHPIPQKNWDRSKPLEMNDAIAQMEYARNHIARFAARFMKKKIQKAVEAGKPDLNMLFIYNMPFRGMAKMMNGMVSMDMAKDILFIVNGHFFRGVGRLIHHFFHRPKLNLTQEA
ncbi:MAG: glycoside hydrolase family 3 C-terminal domain-containing protein [Clostridia bacterium]|nr:glycoside hydrolase family 3 C-terminal domain-containing protein [Clostridia bacterium]